MRWIILVIVLHLPVLAAAQSRERADQILSALKTNRVLAQMQSDSVASGTRLAEQMIRDEVPADWRDRIAAINAPDALRAEMVAVFADRYGAAMADDTLAYLRGGEVQTIIDRELAARSALTDPSVEALAVTRWQALADESPGRADLIARYIAANDLIGANVAAAMNSHAAFLRGLRDGGGPASGRVLDDSAIVARVWRQQDQIRQDTLDWVHAFTTLAYDRVPLADLQGYVAFAETREGGRLTAALFEAFQAIFVTTSYQTGLALAGVIASDDI